MNLPEPTTGNDVLYELWQRIPVTLALVLAGSLYLFVLSLQSLRQTIHNRVYRPFAHIDSEQLDNDRTLARNFYRCALQYRLRHGHKAYTRCIQSKFHFFYEYHNFALQWIDDVITHCGQQPAPVTFIMAIIESGHIGPYYQNVLYATGLPGSKLKQGHALLFHDTAEGIQIWSATSQRPVCVLQKEDVRLQAAHRHPNYLAAILTGTDTHRQQRIQLELHFPATLQAGQPYTRSETQARENLQGMQHWLQQTGEHHSRHPHLDGIEVNEIVAKRDLFKTPLEQKLEQLVYRRVDAYFTRGQLPIADTSVQLDAIVLCNGIGILLIVEKHEQGNISYSGDPDWYQFINDQGFTLKNPCMTSQHTRASVASLLTSNNLTRWPLRSLVVFSKDQVQLDPAFGKSRLQCDVIHLSQFDKWLEDSTRDERIHFTQQDLSRFARLMQGGAGLTHSTGKTARQTLLNQV